jgi:IMP cyclohydrolase
MKLTQIVFAFEGEKYIGKVVYEPTSNTYNSYKCMVIINSEIVISKKTKAAPIFISAERHFKEALIKTPYNI